MVSITIAALMRSFIKERFSFPNTCCFFVSSR